MAERDRHPTERDGRPPTGLPGLRCGKLVAGSLAFVGLTVAIFWYQFSRIQPGDASARWDQLQWGYLVLILLLLPVETVASALRIWVLCRVLEPGVDVCTDHHETRGRARDGGSKT